LAQGPAVTPFGRKFWRGAGAAALAAACMLAAPGAHAGEWLADAKTGCQVWDPNPQLDETVTWSGGCSGGHADGAGKVQWLKDNKLIETDEGEWRDGRQFGKGVQDWPIGRYEGQLADGLPNGVGTLTFQKFRYEGQFRDGKPNGIGSLIEANKTVQGTWKDGCLLGQQKASIGIPLSACR
jgi:hypothetical protein